MFHLLANSAALGVAAANAEIAAVADQEFASPNNRFIFTEDYELFGAYYVAASATDLRLNMPTVNGIARHHVSPLQRNATIPSLPEVVDYRRDPIKLPVKESLVWEGSNNLGLLTEVSTVFSFIRPLGEVFTQPRGLQSLTVAATYTLTTTIGAWTGPGNLTFAEQLKGGWYSVVGVQGIEANILAMRLIFNRPFFHKGRKLRPGWLGTNALGNVSQRDFAKGLGEWGRFHTFEPPQIDVFAIDAAAHTGDLSIELVYHGDQGGPI